MRAAGPRPVRSTSTPGNPARSTSSASQRRTAVQRQVEVLVPRPRRRAHDQRRLRAAADPSPSRSRRRRRAPALHRQRRESLGRPIAEHGHAGACASEPPGRAAAPATRTGARRRGGRARSRTSARGRQRDGGGRAPARGTVHPKLCQSTTRRAPRSRAATRATSRVGMAGGFCTRITSGLRNTVRNRNTRRSVCVAARAAATGTSSQAGREPSRGGGNRWQGDAGMAAQLRDRAHCPRGRRRRRRR